MSERLTKRLFNHIDQSAAQPLKLKLEVKPSLLLELLKRGPIVFPAQQITLKTEPHELIIERSAGGETVIERYPKNGGGVTAALESVNLPF